MERSLAGTNLRRSAVLITLLALLLTMLFPARLALSHGSGTDGSHSHFRYGQLTWVPASYDPANRTVHFTFVAGFRRNGYAGTHPDGLANVGDVIYETIGGTDLRFGDGTGTPVLRFRVTAINQAENWLMAVALDPGNPAKETITHTYPSAAVTYTASSDTCCRAGFILNNTGDYTLITTVRPGGGNSSPHSNLPAIVTVARNTSNALPPQTFSVLGTDVDFDTLAYRLATGAESGTYSMPSGISVNASTGVVSWQNAGLPLGYYTMQVMVEDRDAAGNVKSKVPVDFLLNLVNQTGSAPQFQAPTPAQGSTVTFTPGVAKTVEIRADDADAGQMVSLNHAGLPAGASFTASPGNPAVGHLTWTPTAAQAGLAQVITFYATDNGSPSMQTLRSFTVRVDSNCPPTPGVVWKAPLSAGTPYNMANGSMLPIRFYYGSCGGGFIHDESVVIMVQDLSNPAYPVGAWVYGWDIVIDDAAKEYQLDFQSGWYGLTTGAVLRVEVYLHNTLVGEALVNVTP